MTDYRADENVDLIWRLFIEAPDLQVREKWVPSHSVHSIIGKTGIEFLAVWTGDS